MVENSHIVAMLDREFLGAYPLSKFLGKMGVMTSKRKG